MKIRTNDRNSTSRMDNQFPVIVVPPDATLATEALGTKFKFWFHHPELGYCLYKQARPNTGEDWAEKIVSQLCELLGLPHARIELATWNSTFGTVSPSFVPINGTLILGNEILARRGPDYPQYQAFGVSQHTLDVVLAAISNNAVNQPLDWTPPDRILTAVDTFVGYLLLDAWIGNSDRHHENWGFVETRIESLTPQVTVHLAPTYDHASSLGRELLDVKRQERLKRGSVTAYVAKCRSALYAQVGDKKALFTLDAFLDAKRALSQCSQSVANPRVQVYQLLIRWRYSTGYQGSGFQISRSHAAQEILEINQRRLLELRVKQHYPSSPS